MIKNTQKTSRLIIFGIFLATMLVLALAMPSIASAQYYTYHSRQACSGSNLYWYDSNGNPNDFIQCSNGCYNNSCGYNSYNNYNYNYNSYNNNYNYNNSNCTYHAYKLCVGNSLYWYSGVCNQQQDLAQNCSASGQVCQYGQCTTYIINPVLPPVQPAYNPYYSKVCSGDSIYWRDSLGAVSGLYKSCKDANTCTLDKCSANTCLNTLKCDGSTCATGSSDYNTYCAPAQPSANTQPAQPAQTNTNTQTNSTAQTNTSAQQSPSAPANDQNRCGNGYCEPSAGETETTCPNDCKIDANTNATGLLVSFFTKQDPNSSQWQKTIQINSDSQVYFMVSVVNNSTAQLDNVTVSANIPSEISSLGNAQLDGTPISGDIVSGINIGSIAPSITKSITFEGKTQTISALTAKQATATGSVSGVKQSDSVSINFNPSAQAQAAAAVSNAKSTAGIWGFLKRWYFWILAGLVLVFLFVIVFKRLSSEA